MDTIPLPDGLLERLAAAPLVVTAPPAAVFAVEGPGAVTCLQGLFTNDVAAPGDDALVYGALLTPKGMIRADHWAFRNGGGFVLVTDAAGRAATHDMFRRQLPPRLARAGDLSDAWHVLTVLGPRGPAAAALAAALGGAGWPVPASLPAPGRSVALTRDDGTLRLGQGPATAPFAWIAAGPVPAVAGLAAALAGSGAEPAGTEALRAARVLAGAPTLGAEIGEKTLPQEVRFDELGGVSYGKGCYVGQETVARVHFRGRPNWLLRGLEPLGGGGAGGDDDALTLDGRAVGRVTTVLTSDGRPALALASVRREVEPGTALQAPWGTARVRELPFGRPAGGPDLPETKKAPV